MTDLEKIMEVLGHQEPAGVVSGDWPQLSYSLLMEDDEESGNKDRCRLTIPNAQIGFSFDKSGRLLGIYNWKD